MSSTAAVQEQSRRERAEEIERKHFGQCMWQMIESQYRKMMVECLLFNGGTLAIVVKHYDKAIPRSNSGKPWPELAGHQIYLPVADDDNTWEGLDKALTEAAKV